MKVPYCIIDNKLWVKVPVSQDDVKCQLKVSWDINGKPEPENVFEFYDNFNNGLQKWREVAPNIIQTKMSFDLCHVMECKTCVQSDSLLAGVGIPKYNLITVGIYKKDNQIYFKNEFDDIIESVNYSDGLKYSIDVDQPEYDLYYCQIFESDIQVDKYTYEVYDDENRCNGYWSFFVSKSNENVTVDYVLVRKSFYNETLNVSIEQITDDSYTVNVNLTPIGKFNYIQIPIPLIANFNEHLSVEYFEGVV